MSISISIKENAVQMRKSGKTYSEILKEIPVAKSTLSLWLRDVGLSTKQFQRLTEKRLAAGKRGGEARRQQRIIKTQEILRNSLSDIKHISKRELWIIGIVLYWAEGSKEKEYQHGIGIRFSNSDPRIIQVFLRWLKEICNINEDRIGFEIYIHRNSQNNIDVVRKYWSKITKSKIEKFNTIYYKKNDIKTKRRNTKDLYYGLIRVRVSSSSSLLRQITGWSEAIFRNI